MKTYDIIYSLGIRCSCGLYELKAGLRSYSGPFDWVGDGDFETRVDLIAHSFEHFLEKEDMEFVSPAPPPAPGKEPHDIYVNKRTSLLFVHDFAAGVPMEESFEAVREKYARRARRFLEHVRTKERVLLIWLSLETETPDTVFLEGAERLSRFFGKRIDILAIEHTDTLPALQKNEPAENVTIWRGPLKMCDENGSERIMGNEELILPVFQQYQLPIPLKTRLRRAAYKALINTVCLFLPVKSWRKKLRMRHKAWWRYEK